jgi:DNA transposition AAA+ family ATPase
MSDTDRPALPSFIPTKPFRQFVEFCTACRRQRSIGLCFGAPGVGKTASARRVAGWDQIEPVLPYLGYTSLPVAPPADLVGAPTIFYTAPVVNSPRQTERDLQRLSRRIMQLRGLTTTASAPAMTSWPPPTPGEAVELVLIDEADRLKMLALEQVRDRYDRGQHGLVLIGLPGIEKRMARFAQLCSRVGFVHEFQALSDAEVQFVLAQQWPALGLRFSPTEFADQEALMAIIRITGGNFRLLVKLFAQIERILRINDRSTVTSEVVETARSSLVIGAA